VSAAVPGDASGCSQLGAELRSRAAELLDLHARLADQHSNGSRGRRRAGPDPLLVEQNRLSLDTVAVRLDAAGASLQLYAQELAGLAEEARRLERAASAVGLALDGLRVVEPWGVAPPDVARARLDALPELQRRSERLASRLGRARGSLRRALDEGRGALADTATGMRRSLG